jgi:phosphoribosylaminoimidazolecarboxamide formyltransferase/IMP cyclohydrolase
MVSKLHGKELSFNNLLDLDSARRLAHEFEVPAAVIVKHNNPCGCAVGSTPLEAFEKALACDPVSAFGGVFCFNRPIGVDLAERLNSMFVEVVMTKGYEDGALDVLCQKENVRVLHDAERRREPTSDRDMRRVRGGLLIQDRDEDVEMRDEMQVVTERHPTEQEWGEMLFAWKVCKHVRSNAIVLSKDLASVGVGAGQMSRVDSVRIAVDKAQCPLQEAALASDAFFPFADGPQVAIEAGVTAIIQPGGSKRDDEVIAACDEAGIAMVFAARRHFRH